MASLVVSHMEQSGVRVMRHSEPAALEKVDNGRLMVISNEKGHENSSKVSPHPHPPPFLLPSPSSLSLSLFLSLSLPSSSPLFLPLSLLLVVSFCRKNGIPCYLLQVHMVSLVIYMYTFTCMTVLYTLASRCILGLAPRILHPVNIK